MRTTSRNVYTREERWFTCYSKVDFFNILDYTRNLITYLATPPRNYKRGQEVILLIDRNMAAQQSGAAGSDKIEGSLSYWTTVVNKWQNRWCVLKEDGHLYYYAVSMPILVVLFRYQNN